MTQKTRLEDCFDAQSIEDDYMKRLEAVVETLKNQKKNLSDNEEFFGEKTLNNMGTLPLQNVADNMIERLEGDIKKINSILLESRKAAWTTRSVDIKGLIEYYDSQIRDYSSNVSSAEGKQRNIIDSTPQAQRNLAYTNQISGYSREINMWRDRISGVEDEKRRAISAKERSDHRLEGILATIREGEN